MTTIEMTAWMLRSMALAAAALALQRAWPAQRRRIPLIAFAALLVLTVHAFLGGPLLAVPGPEMTPALFSQRASGAWGERWLLRLYLLGGALFLAREAVGFARLRALLRDSVSLRDEGWERSLQACADQLGLQRRPELRVCERLSPAATGARRQIILLPPGCEGWSEERRRFVLLHELAHFCHGDLPARLVARAACVVQWFNPLAWLLAWRMELDREVACDLRVAEETQQPAGYAETLLLLAELRSSSCESALASTFGARRGSMLEARLRRLLAPAGSLPRALRAAAGTAAGALLLIALVLCACKFQPSPKEDSVWTPEEVRQRLNADPFPDGAG